MNQISVNLISIVSIPQAVSTVATSSRGIPLEKKSSWTVSIPQAVSTVATFRHKKPVSVHVSVSIPQAVSTVATVIQDYAEVKNQFLPFQYRKR